VLRHLRSALTRDGGELLVFTVPAFQFLWSPWDDVEHHQRRYRIAQAKRLARDCGFEVLRATYFFFPLFFAALAVKSLRAGRARLRGRPPAPRFDALLEARSNPVLNRVMTSVLAPERVWLRHGNVPLGTSVLIVARPT
jgi:hypothetical protein